MEDFQKDEIKINGMFWDGEEMYFKATTEPYDEMGFDNNYNQKKNYRVELIAYKHLGSDIPILTNSVSIKDLRPVLITPELLIYINFKLATEGKKQTFVYEDCSISKEAGQNDDWTITSQNLKADKPVSFVHEVQNFVYLSTSLGNDKNKVQAKIE